MLACLLFNTILRYSFWYRWYVFYGRLGFNIFLLYILSFLCSLYIVRNDDNKDDQSIKVKSYNPWCDRPWVVHSKTGVRHLLHISRKTCMLHGMVVVTTFDRRLNTRFVLLLNWLSYATNQISNIQIASRNMCHDKPEWGRIRQASSGRFRPDFDSITWLVYMDPF